MRTRSRRTTRPSSSPPFLPGHTRSSTGRPPRRHDLLRQQRRTVSARRSPAEARAVTPGQPDLLGYQGTLKGRASTRRRRSRVAVMAAVNTVTALKCSRRLPRACARRRTRGGLRLPRGLLGDAHRLDDDARGWAEEARRSSRSPRSRAPRAQGQDSKGAACVGGGGVVGVRRDLLIAVLAGLLSSAVDNVYANGSTSASDAASTHRSQASCWTRRPPAHPSSRRSSLCQARPSPTVARPSAEPPPSG